MGHRPASAFAMAIALLACGCGASKGPGAAEPSEADEGRRANEPIADSTPAAPEEREEALPAPTERHLAVRWDQLADPHSQSALIVRTLDEWEELFVGSPPESVDFGRAIVVGVVQPDMASVRIDDVRVEGGEVVVSATVELPNPSCGEAPPGALDLMVIEKVDMNIRFDLVRRTAQC